MSPRPTRHTRTLPRRSAACAAALVGLAAMLGPATPVFAQPGQIVSIDPGTAQSVALSAEQQSEIDRFVEALRPSAFGEDRSASRRAVGQLIEPLLDPGVSVAFRQAMASRLDEAIAEALRDDRVLLEDGKINHKPYAALRLAGELATESTLRYITDNLDSADPGRRFFAIHCGESVLFAVRTAAPAITARALLNQRPGGQSTGLLADLAETATSSDSPAHAGAAIRALAEATGIRDDQAEGVSQAALRMIASSASTRIRRADPQTVTDEERRAWLTAGQSVFRVIADNGITHDASSGLASVRLAGHLIASIYRGIEAGRLPAVATPDGSVMEKQTIGLAQNLLQFGEQIASSGSGRPFDRNVQNVAGSLLDAYTGEGDQSFTRAALNLISPQGTLTAPPFGFPDDEFVRE